MKLKLGLSSLLLICSLNAEQFDSNINQVQIEQASKNHLEAVDFMLNKAYMKLINVLDNQAKKDLKTAQRSWLKYRDFNTKVSSSAYRNGSIHGTIHNQALIEITNNRTAELSKMFLSLTTK